MGQENEDFGTFVQSEGLPANRNAKRLAKAKSKKTKNEANTFYTLKGVKVLKMIAKANGAYSVYVGNMRKHKDALELMIKKWRADGVWIEPHLLEAKMAEIVSQLSNKE